MTKSQFQSVLEVAKRSYRSGFIDGRQGCREGYADPEAWIAQNEGQIRAMVFGGSKPVKPPLATLDELEDIFNK